eukprot:Gb_39642 [translate_table: standard]
MYDPKYACSALGKGHEESLAGYGAIDAGGEGDPTVAYTGEPETGSNIPTAVEYLCDGMPFKLSKDDVYITNGGAQAINVSLSVLAREHANILLPRPGFLIYEAMCAYHGIEARHYPLIPERDWEVDLDEVRALADSNPSNPTGTVFSDHRLL